MKIDDKVKIACAEAIAKLVDGFTDEIEKYVIVGTVITAYLKETQGQADLIASIEQGE